LEKGEEGRWSVSREKGGWLKGKINSHRKFQRKIELVSMTKGERKPIVATGEGRGRRGQAVGRTSYTSSRLHPNAPPKIINT